MNAQRCQGARTRQGTCRTSANTRTRTRLHPCCVAASRTLPPQSPRAAPNHEAFDVVLSSGFLAFANHAGFLRAVEETGLPVGGVMGTSAGALTGSLYCAGYTPMEVARHLSQQAPASLLRPSLAPWQGGVLSLEGVVERLRELLPPTFEELEREFAVGVVTADGEHVLIDSGPLPEAVAASAAIPFIFESVEVPGPSGRLGPLKDGGVADRIGLKAWRDRRRRQMLAAGGSVVRPPPCLVHVIDRSSPFSGFDDAWATGEPNILVVNSPRARANFFDLGSFAEHMEAATERARPHLARARRGLAGSGAAAAAVAAAAAAASAAAAAAMNGSASSAGSSSSAVVASGPALVVNGVLAAGAAEQGTAAAAARQTL